MYSFEVLCTCSAVLVLSNPRDGEIKRNLHLRILDVAAAVNGCCRLIPSVGFTSEYETHDPLVGRH